MSIYPQVTKYVSLGRLENAYKRNPETFILLDQHTHTYQSLPIKQSFTLHKAIMSGDLFDTIMIEDGRGNEPELQRIFRSITTADLNRTVRWDPHSTMLIALLNQFDTGNRYPNLVLNLFDSPRVQTNLLQVNRANTQNGVTPLMHTALRGQLELSQILLSLGARADIMTSTNATPLYHACMKGHVAIFRLLCPLVPSHHFTITRPHNQRTIRDEVVEKLSTSANYAQLLQLIDAEQARRGLV